MKCIVTLRSILCHVKVIFKILTKYRILQVQMMRSVTVSEWTGLSINELARILTTIIMMLIMLVTQSRRIFILHQLSMMTIFFLFLPQEIPNDRCFSGTYCDKIYHSHHCICCRPSGSNDDDTVFIAHKSNKKNGVDLVS